MAVFAALILAGCSGGSATQGGDTPGPPAGASRGTIAFVDANGCIARVDGGTGKAVAQPFCTSSRAGVTSLTWLDEDRLAFNTAEGKGLGWQVVNFTTNAVEVMPMVEAPRVSIIPPQYWSPRGEQVRVEGGRALVISSESIIQVYPQASRQTDRSTRLVAWSPDADAVILSVTTNKELWVVDRDGDGARKVASASKGIASWWMPHVGATPHADLTCSVIVEGSYTCLPGVRGPREGETTYDFAWSPCPGATGYEFEVLDSAGKRVYSTVTSASFLHVPRGGLDSGEFTWRIRSLIGPEPAPWSEAQPLTPAASLATAP